MVKKKRKDVRGGFPSTEIQISIFFHKKKKKEEKKKKSKNFANVIYNSISKNFRFSKKKNKIKGKKSLLYSSIRVGNQCMNHSKFTAIELLGD